VILRRATGTLLLACTLFGVVSLHTLGHSGAHHSEPAASTGFSMPSGFLMSSGSAASSGAVVGGPDSDPVPARGSAVGQPCERTGCHWMATWSGPRLRDSTLWDVCLAVLTGCLVVILARALTAGAAIPARAAARPGSAHQRPRAPPGPGAGLQIAMVSVLRV
jgi:hypothetical protein